MNRGQTYPTPVPVIRRTASHSSHRRAATASPAAELSIACHHNGISNFGYAVGPEPTYA